MMSATIWTGCAIRQTTDRTTGPDHTRASYRPPDPPAVFCCPPVCTARSFRHNISRTIYAITRYCGRPQLATHNIPVPSRMITGRRPPPSPSIRMDICIAVPLPSWQLFVPNPHASVRLSKKSRCSYVFSTTGRSFGTLPTSLKHCVELPSPKVRSVFRVSRYSYLQYLCGACGADALHGLPQFLATGGSKAALCLYPPHLAVHRQYSASAQAQRDGAWFGQRPAGLMIFAL